MDSNAINSAVGSINRETNKISVNHPEDNAYQTDATSQTALIGYNSRK